MFTQIDIWAFEVNSTLSGSFSISYKKGGVYFERLSDFEWVAPIYLAVSLPYSVKRLFYPFSSMEGNILIGQFGFFMSRLHLRASWISRLCMIIKLLIRLRYQFDGRLNSSLRVDFVDACKIWGVIYIDGFGNSFFFFSKWPALWD